MDSGQVIVTQSAKIKKLVDLAKRIGNSTASVLLTGESGTGKELFAEVIHQSSARRDQRLIRLNCAALSKDLIESELFGHVQGAFTNAVSDRQGRFELARNGTLLLDEISEVPLSTQAKLLRVLENNEFERVGDSEPVRHDARVIASTNRDLAVEIENGRFRLDLFHRINVVQLRIPPLRRRREDVPVLAMHFVERFKHESQVGIRGFSKEAMRMMADYDWPGNVRELRNVVHRACILSDEELISTDCLELPGFESSKSKSDSSPDELLPDQWLQTELAEIERQIILAALNKYGNRRVVAEKLGVSQRTLANKLRRYREDHQWRTEAA